MKKTLFVKFLFLLLCGSVLTTAGCKDYYNRGIQMYRFPNSDVQKSVIFEGIKKRLKIV